MKSGIEQKVCAVILTYKDRINYVKEVSNALFEQGVSQIILVANGTPEGRLKELEPDQRITTIALSQNFGSGKGYRVGIEAAMNSSCDFLWLLDDDNRPAPDCLRVLWQNWAHFVKTTPADQLALSCYRDDQFDNRELNVYGNKLFLQPRLNSYHGFHIKRILKLIYERIIEQPAKYVTDLSGKAVVYESDGAFFGGLFVHRTLIQKISLPNDHYFVYVDDLEYTHRIIEEGGKIKMICDAKIHGLDWSIPFQCRTSKLYHSTLDYVQPFRTYYCARNIEDFTRNNFVSNKLLYYFNLTLFVMTIGTMALLRGRLGHYKLLLSGIKDSWMGKFGENLNLKTKIQ
ncbi:MAG: glycosyltransferase [Cytophagia bacterium]|nr:glycosyltransferase [Cytophagia bacterium]